MSFHSAASPNSQPPRPRGYQFTIREMMRLVGFSAMTFAALVPAVRGTWMYPSRMIFYEVLILTGTWMAFVLFFVRQSPLQVWLMRGILLLPIILGSVVVVGILISVLVYYPTSLLQFILGFIVIGIPVGFILARVSRYVLHLLPVHCPVCKTLSMISDTGSNRPVLRGLKATRWCWSCRSRYGRLPGREWEPAMRLFDR